VPPFQEADKQRDITLIYGKTGMGKSRLNRGAGPHPGLISKVRRLIVVDPMNEYPGVYFSDLARMCEFIAHYRTFKVRTDRIDQFPLLCEIACAAGDLLFVVEEAQRVLPASQAKLPPEFQNLVFRGRHWRVSLTLVSQRPSTVNVHARSQWNRIYTFNQTEPGDVQWLENTSGFDVPAATLRPLEYFAITPGAIEKKTLPLLPGERLQNTNAPEKVDNAPDVPEDEDVDDETPTTPQEEDAI